jgi:hypothetical protein
VYLWILRTIHHLKDFKRKDNSESICGSIDDCDGLSDGDKNIYKKRSAERMNIIEILYIHSSIKSLRDTRNKRNKFFIILQDGIITTIQPTKMNGVSHDMIFFSIKKAIHFCRMNCSDNLIPLYYDVDSCVKTLNI